MFQQVIIAIGAGLASALLFFIPMKGTAYAMIALFSALPLMIAGLSFNPFLALVGAVAGSLALFFGLTLVADVDSMPALLFCGFFAATSALPAWHLTRLAWLGRPPMSGETPASDGMVWYPIGNLVAWMVAMAAAASLGGLFIAVATIGSFDTLASETARVLEPVLQRLLTSLEKLPANMTAEDIGRAFVLSMPPALAAWTLLGMALNLWLAARIAVVSQSMRRPWMDLPENFDLPRAILPAFAAAVALSLIDGLPRVIGATIAVAIGAALALKGLATIHSATRKMPSRVAILAAVYMTMLVLFPIPAPLLTALGLSVMLNPRKRPPALPPAANSN